MRRSSLRTLFLPGLSKATSTQGGFSLLELLVVIIIAGILASIAAPGWLGYLDRRRLAAAQDTIYQGLQQARTKSEQTATAWRFGIREQGGDAQWAVYPAASTPSNWETLGNSIQIDTTNSIAANGDGIHSVRYDQKGQVNLGTFTVQSKSGSAARRCVRISTLIGTIKKLDECS